MTAGRQQSTQLRRTGRIIERPRLMKLLDESDAPVILLVGPAGYGKTTLARQWTRTLNGVIWITCTPAHRDVVTFAEDIAAGIDGLGGTAGRFIGEYIRAKSNPQSAAREIASVLAEQVNDTPVQWLIVDDYHELGESDAAHELVATLRARVDARILIASRTRPHWLSTRDIVYGDVTEIGAPDLALTAEETALVVGKRPDLEPVIEQARGWPAVLTLAAALTPGAHRGDVVPAMLHEYVADELFRSVQPDLRERLAQLALMPTLARQALVTKFGSKAQDTLTEARGLGFIGDTDPTELHPLLREFLLSRLTEDPRARELVERAIWDALDSASWDFALELVFRFKILDLVDPVLHKAFRPLVSDGRVGTLARFAIRIREAPGFPPPAVELIEAEVALRDGQLQLAAELARRSHSRLAADDPLLSRASLTLGRASFLASEFGAAAEGFEDAVAEAVEEEDWTEGVFGLAAVLVFGELGDAAPWLEKLAARQANSPELLVRHATAEISMRRFAGGLSDPLHLDETLHHLPAVRDPKVRSAYCYTSAYALAQRADYADAERLIAPLADDVKRFGLEFAQPFLDWTSAFIKLGLRQFGEADRLIQAVEDRAAQRQHDSHALNARLIRARLHIQKGSPEAAVDLLQPEHTSPVYPSWLGEFHALRAIALALVGSERQALKEVERAQAVTTCLEVHVLARSARALAEFERDPAATTEMMAYARQVNIWDPVINALRASPRMLDRVATDPTLRPDLIGLIHRAEDSALARQAGIRLRSYHAPADLLSPREQEVLGLVAQGMRNREIAAALYVAESTVKIHVRHILEKLGVRTRAEAVARVERLRASG